MRVIPPVAITDALLTSSTVVETASAAYVGGTTYALNATASVAGALGAIAEYKSIQTSNTGHAPASSPLWWAKTGDTYQLYSGAATYALGETVIDAVNHYVYESKAAGNIGHALTDVTYWLCTGRTNRWAMFELKSNQRTRSPLSLTLVVTPGERCNTIALGNIVANIVDLSVSSGGVVTYTDTSDLNTREAFNYYDYCFKPFSTQSTLIRFDLPPHTNAVITVTLTATEGDVELGAFAIGTYNYIGGVQYNAEDDAKNYSTVERNFDGSISNMVPRLSVPSMTETLSVDKVLVNSIRKLRTQLNGQVAVWSGLDDDSDGYFDSLFSIGFFTQFKFNLANPENAEIALAVESI